MLLAVPLGERVKELREQRRLTQEGLAARIGVSRKTVSNWETGETTISTAHLPALAAALGVRQAELLEGDAPQAGEARKTPGYDGVTDRNVVGRLEDLRRPGVLLLPIYRWGSLGDPRDRESAPYPDRLSYPPLGRENLVGPNGFGVEVQGESMVGRDIRNGDVCWVNPERPYRIGGVVLALVENPEGDSGMVVKTYARTEVGDCLMSHTADGPSTVICQQFKIIGPVVWIERGFPPR